MAALEDQRAGKCSIAPGSAIFLRTAWARGSALLCAHNTYSALVRGRKESTFEELSEYLQATYPGGVLVAEVLNVFAVREALNGEEWSAMKD